MKRRRQAEAGATAAATPATDPSLLIRPHSPSFGPVDAKVALVEFFGPSCATLPGLSSGSAGNPQAVHHRFPCRPALQVVHERSDEAVRILEAAPMQDMLEPVRNVLSEEQPGCAVDGAPQPDLAWEIAEGAGLDPEKAEGDRLFPWITAVLDQDTVNVKALGVLQTPTFFLNGKRMEQFSAQSLTVVVRLLVENS